MLARRGNDPQLTAHDGHRAFNSHLFYLLTDGLSVVGHRTRQIAKRLQLRLSALSLAARLFVATT